ncbi:MAG: hypothetical protein SPK50_00810 [Mobiluncus porci]|uniref:hypothetical protein n=1 Tax=Mobiluncus porci TaxID=2652278 RepID=UPI0023F13CD9|nr:hypothetical protein [Mobiluncus porci]MDD7542039.1 hypothetical protein [Mobiluncus porci]MDY5747661.1 hypothetical protein [Mobiluncus porci]
MENRERNVNGLDALRALDPAQNLEVDLSAMRAKVAALMSAEGLAFDAEVPAVVEPLDSPEIPADAKSDNVISLEAHRQANPLRRNWLIGLSAAAAAAVVGFTGWATLFPQSDGEGPVTPGTTGPGSSQPRLQASGASLAVPGAEERLSEVGAVDFVAAKEFSSQATKAPAYRVTKGKAVSSGEVQKVAQSLGMRGPVQKSGSGYTVKDSSGATLTVTVGELTSLSFNNPSAVHMVCVPVNPGDGNVALPNPNQTKTPSPATSSPSTAPSATPSPAPSEAPSQIELPPSDPTPTTKPPVATPTETPTESVPPAVRPGVPSPRTTPTETAGEMSVPSEPQVYNYSPAESQSGSVVEIGELHVWVYSATVNSDSTSGSTNSAGETPEPTVSDKVEVQSTQSPSPKPTDCVMKVAGEAPSTEKALAEVAKVASSLGATVVSSQAGVSQKDGLTTVDVPVKMPGQAQAQTWRAVVSSQGLASIRANLGKETKLGDYQVISEKEAVNRLNNPAYGPLDVFDPSGKATVKITGKIELVDAKLTNAPVKQKDGAIVSMPVYQLTDTQGKIWTVLAVADSK